MESRPFSVLSVKKFLNENKLMGTKCKKCGTLFSPPRPICIKCYAKDMEWVELKGKGKLTTFTVIYVGPPWMMAQGFNRQNPYVSGVVELEEGVKIDARIAGLDTSKPEAIKIGIPLKVDFQHVGEGDKKDTFLIFKPV